MMHAHMATPVRKVQAKPFATHKLVAPRLVQWTQHKIQDHELIYQRAAVSQPSMQNDVSMAPISTRAQSTADPRSQSNGTLQVAAIM